ncbi:unnamed protein product, partial [Linum tenue]
VGALPGRHLRLLPRRRRCSCCLRHHPPNHLRQCHPLTPGALPALRYDGGEDAGGEQVRPGRHTQSEQRGRQEGGGMEEQGLFFMETSVRDSTNVEAAFEVVIREIFNNLRRKVLSSDSSKPALNVVNTVSLLNNGAANRTSYCSYSS